MCTATSLHLPDFEYVSAELNQGTTQPAPVSVQAWLSYLAWTADRARSAGVDREATRESPSRT